MRALINSLAVIGALICGTLALNLLFGFAFGAFDGTSGQSTATQQKIALFAAAVALAFGFLGRIQDRRMPRPASKLSDSCIAVGLIAGLLVLALPFAFG